jgi:FkbM family methyltransferase
VTIRSVSTPGGVVFVDDADRGSVAKSLLTRGRYEKTWTAWVQATVRPGMRTLDIGANIGYYSALLATLVGPTGAVVACEPDPVNASLLRRTIAANGFRNVRVVEAAVSDRVGRATLYQDREWYGVHSLSRDNCVNPGDGQVEVATTTLDALLGEAGPIDFVKMDAQGAEASILASAGALLSQPHLIVLMELWPHGLKTLGGSVSAVTEPFRQHGFASFTQHPESGWGPIDQETIEQRGSTLGTWSSFNLVWIK